MTAPVLRDGAVPSMTRFSFGMGLDSACIALRWLEEPDSRDGIDLDSVTLTVAMTGDECDETRRMMETHLLPRLREHRVRLVQLSRASQSGGYVVLDDSRSPRRMVMRGPWKLSDEHTAAGTAPQLSSHLCSIRSKAEPVDWWAADEYGDRPVFHVVGYAADLWRWFVICPLSIRVREPRSRVRGPPAVVSASVWRPAGGTEAPRVASVVPGLRRPLSPPPRMVGLLFENSRVLVFLVASSVSAVEAVVSGRCL